MKHTAKLNKVLRQHGLRKSITGVRTIYIGEYSRQEINRMRRDKAFINTLNQL